MSPDQLAINGASPVTEDSVPFHRPSVGKQEAEYAKKSIESRYVVGPGPYCKKVEEHVEDEWNIPRALTVTSCTHAMELALICAEVEQEDEIIVPSFTYVSTAQAVLRAGATPVFADVDPETLTLTPETLNDALTDRTRGVIMVHYGGFPGPVQSIQEFCEDNNLFCVEDAAQVYDTKRDGNMAGTVGRFGCISFHGTKAITSGEGGLLVINNEEDVARCEMIRDKGTDRSQTRLGDVDRYTWRTVGSSYVLSDILGAVLWKQIERWPKIRKRRREVQNVIRSGLEKIDTDNKYDVLYPPENCRENGLLTALLLDDSDRRDWLLEALQAEGIQAREHYHPLHETPYAQENLDVPDSLPGTERISSSITRIPAHPEMDDDDIENTLKALRKVYTHI
ncbi:MAG: aminotransferase class I/II-fold pyridoxal phosphate-dependent enzyme [bacterium]